MSTSPGFIIIIDYKNSPDSNMPNKWVGFGTQDCYKMVEKKKKLNGKKLAASWTE